MALYTGSTLCKILSRRIINSLTSNNVTIISQRSIGRHVAPLLMELERRRKKQKPTISRRSSYTDWNLNAEIFAFGKRLGEEFQIEKLLQAFIHRSYIVSEEMKQKEAGIDDPQIDIEDNEELAEIGEKIISDYVRQYLPQCLPRFPAEGIESISAYLTSDEVLAGISKDLGTTEIILSDDYPVEKATYVKTLKAIVGALSASQGVERANLFVRDFVITKLSGQDVNDFFHIENPLEILSEILQRDGRGIPEPRLICKSAVNTILANYHVGIYSDKTLVGHGSGETINTAIEMAARGALRQFFHTTDSSPPIRFDLQQISQQPRNVSIHEWSTANVESPN